MKSTDEKTAIILAQWQTCVEMANSVSQRRDTMNTIFTTLNLAIIAAVSMTWELKSILVLVAGIVFCVIWLLFIRNYKLLNTEKFNVINDIENYLPVKPFNDEWEKLNINRNYKDTTKLERIIPIMFISIYAILLFYLGIFKCIM